MLRLDNNLTVGIVRILLVAIFGVICAPLYAADPVVSENPAANEIVNSTALLASEASVSELSKAATSQGVSTGQYMNLVLGLVAIIAFIFLVAWMLRRVGGTPNASSGAMKIVSGLSLGNRDRVVLLQVGDQQILVGASPGNINLIHAFDEPAIMVERTSQGSDFYQKLQASLNRGEKS